MEKVKETIKKHENIIIAIFIILMIIGYCVNIYVCSGDELWNFQNIYKMLNGYKIYTDANVIITPLFYFVGFILLKIFGQNILIFRLYNILIMASMYFLIYLVLKELCKNRFSILIYFCIIIFETITLCSSGANYNVLAIDFVLLGILLNLRWIKKQEKHNIIQSIIMFVVFFTKQNIGAFYILGMFLYQIIKEKSIKNIIKQVLLFGILIGISMILFMYFNIFNDFINYAILGIREFTKQNIGGSFTNIIRITFPSIFILFFTIFLIKKDKIQKNDKNKLILLTSVSIPLILIEFPIFNNYHMILGNLLILITIIYILDYIFFGNMTLGKWKKFLKILLGIIIAINMYMSIIHLLNWLNQSIKNSYFDYEHPFYGGSLIEKNIQEYEEILNYIKNSEENVIVLTEDAALYMVSLKRSNGAMDLPFLGNMGKDGENGMIKKIQEMHNIKFLIKKDEKELFWQESKKLNQFIKEKLNYIGDIENLSIYEHK